MRRRGEQTFDLRAWIREQPHKGCVAHLEDDDHFVLETDYATAFINFYDMAPEPEIVELHIEEKATGEAKFFLHFHPVERDHSIQLIREMEQALKLLVGSQRAEILLCCTAGMTTTFFAEKLNQAAEELGLDWGFSAVSVTEAYEYGQDKAAILIAPQIAYQAKRVQQVMSSVPVLQIPTATFAAHDAASCLEWVREELHAHQEASESEGQDERACPVESKLRVLVISAHAALNEMTLHYRIYHKGSVELDRKVIKRSLKVADITDVLDMQLCTCKRGESIDAVGIALPGSLRGGRVGIRGTQVDFETGTDGLALADYLSSRYDIPVRLYNNTNAAALGWHEVHPEYDNVTFYSQAPGWTIGGQGHLVGGRLVEGVHGNAGEVLAQLSRAKRAGAAFIAGAAAAVVVTVDGEKIDTWIEDGSIALAYMHLVASDLGLGSCWVQMHLCLAADGTDSEQAVREALGLGEEQRVVGILALGHPAQELPTRDTPNVDRSRVRYV